MVGYRIVYGNDPVQMPQKSGSQRIRLLIGLSFLAFALAVRLAWPEGRELLVMQFLPGESSVAQAAFSEFLDNLRTGRPMVDSMTVFCQEVLHEIL